MLWHNSPSNLVTDNVRAFKVRQTSWHTHTPRNKSRHVYTHKCITQETCKHILQKYQLKPCDGNGTSKLNIGVFVACLEMWQIHGCTLRRLCDGLPSLAPRFSATDSEMHVHHSNRYSLYQCLHPVKQPWFILAIHGEKLSDAITQNHLPPVCFVTTQHLKHVRKGGRDVRSEFGKAQESGVFIVFWDRVNVYICLFFAL